MILKMTNKSENFYSYMGKVFGSRIIQSETNDRIYDDNNKEWYVYVKEDNVVAFVSICDNIIKNIYSSKECFLEELLLELNKDYKILPSIVTKKYEDIYRKCNFKIFDSVGYKNFIKIGSDNNE